MISVDNLQAARWVRRASCIAAMVMTAAAATVIAFDDPAAAVEMCRGQAATLVGTDGDDRLTGTESSDVIVALGRNHVI